VASIGRSIVVALRRSTGTRPRRGLITGTALLAAVIAAGIATSPHHSLIDIATPVLSVVSIFVPYVGILLMSDLRRPEATDPLGPSVVAAVLVGAALGAFGVIVSLIAAAIAGSDGLSDTWVTVAIAGVVVQVVPALLGTAAGLLLRPTFVAFLATIVVPIGVWLLLAPLDGLRSWVAPYEVARHLLAGQISAIVWAQWLVVAVLWGGVLNAVGARRRLAIEP